MGHICSSSRSVRTFSVAAMPIDLYFTPASAPCRSVLMVAKELDVALNPKELNLMAGDQMKPEFLALNPQHVVPTIDDNGFNLWESRAILGYLANRYDPTGKLYPQDALQRAQVDRILYFDMGTLYKAFAEYMYPQLFAKAPADPEKEKQLKSAMGFLDIFLTKTPYVAGSQKTIADFAVYATVSTIEACDFDMTEYPKVKSWLQRFQSEVSHLKETNEDGNEKFRQWYLDSKA